MYRPSALARGRGATSIAIPAPVMGLNARDSVQAMDPRFALKLDNYFPDGNDVKLRKGFASHVTGLPAEVESLMAWEGPTTRKLKAASGTAIYDVTSAGAVGAAELSSLTNAQWTHTMMGTSGGNYLIIANAADTVRSYDGTNWAVPAITGVTSSLLNKPVQHKSRLWFVEEGVDSAWYLGTNAIAGAATEFPLYGVFKDGGALAYCAPVSRDAGDGMDDFMCFISTKGEVLVYSGTDPSSNFVLQQTFRMGAPISDRAVTRLHGDTLVITDEGVQSLLALFNQTAGSDAANVAVTDIISPLFTTDVVSDGTRYWWQPIYYPRGYRLIVNVPTSATTARQYVMNTRTGAWCRFTAMNAFSWAVLGNDLYFGGDETVYQADTGRDDNGSNIDGVLKTAFSYPGGAGMTKRFTLLRAIMQSNGTPTPAVGLNVDFEDVMPTDTPTFESSGAVWDTAIWDTDVWGGAETVTRSWAQVEGYGNAVAIHMKTATQDISLSVSAFDLHYEPETSAAIA